jgi:hypothetical protein
MQAEMTINLNQLDFYGKAALKLERLILPTHRNYLKSSCHAKEFSIVAAYRSPEGSSPLLTTCHRPGREARIYGAGHCMIGTVLMLFFGLPSITRLLYAT